GEAAEEPIIEVERIYYRNDPIILGSPPFKAPNDSTYYMNLFGGLMMQTELERIGVPDVRGVYFHDIGGRMFVVVSIKQRYAGHSTQAALQATELASQGGFAGRYTVVVDEDIDITDLKDVVWAMCTRSDTVSDIDIVRRARSTPIDPLIRKPARSYSQSKAIIDACKPFDWKDEFPRVVSSSPEMLDAIRKKWKSLFP
ncbi:MAG: ubiquinone biosynthesis protein UbiD, partial [Dehalococcoidia bacterium]|nr:ubiquinone biosynthesis protein UbiD [Dehalococcoidia bacterium]